MVPGIACGFTDLVDDVGRGGKVGIPHSQIDDVLAGPTTGAGQLGDFGQDIGRQAIQFIEVVSKFVGHLTGPIALPTLRPFGIGREQAGPALFLWRILGRIQVPIRSNSIDRPPFLVVLLHPPASESGRRGSRSPGGLASRRRLAGG